MTINVKQINTSTIALVDNGFTCRHDHILLDRPCCAPGTQDCDCKGMWGLYCPDCKNEDLTDAETITILEGNE